MKGKEEQKKKKKKGEEGACKLECGVEMKATKVLIAQRVGRSHKSWAIILKGYVVHLENVTHLYAYTPSPIACPTHQSKNKGESCHWRAATRVEQRESSGGHEESHSRWLFKRSLFKGKKCVSF